MGIKESGNRGIEENGESRKQRIGGPMGSGDRGTRKSRNREIEEYKIWGLEESTIRGKRGIGKTGKKGKGSENRISRDPIGKLLPFGSYFHAMIHTWTFRNYYDRETSTASDGNTGPLRQKQTA